jgi:hypothetical protein
LAVLPQTNCEKDDNMVRNYCQLTVQIIAEDLNTNREILRLILTKYLNMKTDCDKMVPVHFCHEQNSKGKEIC